MTWYEALKIPIPSDISQQVCLLLAHAKSHIWDHQSIISLTWGISILYTAFDRYSSVCEIQDNTLSIVSRLEVGWSKNHGLIPSRVKRFFLSPHRTHWLWGPQGNPVQWLPGTLSQGVNSWSLKLTTDLQLVARLRIHGSIPPRPHISSWHGS